MKYIIEINQMENIPTDCKKCIFTDFNGNCAIKIMTGVNVLPCPIKELKPKQLEWEEVQKDYTFTFYFKAVTPVGIYFYYRRRGMSGIVAYWNKERLNINIDTIDNAKQLCQNHYNKIFYEMIEV